MNEIVQAMRNHAAQCDVSDPIGHAVARVLTQYADRLIDELPDELTDQAEQLAKTFHCIYEELAPRYGYKTRDASAKPWKQVPAPNRKLMIATVQKLLDIGAISLGITGE